MGARRRYDDHCVCIAGMFDVPEHCAIDQRTLLEAVPYGWWYCARLNERQVIASLTTDRATARSLGLSSLGSWFAHLARTQHLGVRLHGSRLAAAGLRCWAAPSYHLQGCSGDTWLAVGDSASCFDPLTAQGIHKALHMGINAAAALVQRIQGVTGDFTDYEHSVTHGHREYLRLRSWLYEQEQRWSGESFWRARQRAAERHEHH
jgi:flavin-dependent dehydrogenase